jgi:hypothetical protein
MESSIAFIMDCPMGDAWYGMTTSQAKEIIAITRIGKCPIASSTRKPWWQTSWLM